MTKALLEVDFRESKISQFIIILIHSAALAAIFFTSLDWQLKILFVALVIVLSCIGHCFLNGKAVTGIRFYRNHWHLKIGGEWLPALPKGQAYVSNYLICLTLRKQKSLWNNKVYIFCDSADSKKIHALRLMLVLNGQACLK